MIYLCEGHLLRLYINVYFKLQWFYDTPTYFGIGQDSELAHLHLLVNDRLLMAREKEDDEEKNEMPGKVHHPPIWSTRHLIEK